MTQPEIPGTDVGRPVMPYGSDGTNWIALLVDALGRLQIDAEVGNFPADPATQTTLAATLTALQSIQNLVGALNDVGLDELRVRGSHGDKVFSFESVVGKETHDEDLDAGPVNLDGPDVPDNMVWRINQVAWMYAGTVPDRVSLVIPSLAGGIYLQITDNPTHGLWYLWQGEIWMSQDLYVRMIIADATLHDAAYLRYTGIQMNAP